MEVGFQIETLWSQTCSCYPRACSASCICKQDVGLHGKCCFYILFQGLPGKTEEKEMKAEALEPRLLLPIEQ